MSIRPNTLEAAGARRLWDESLFSAPQLKRTPLGPASSALLDQRFDVRDIDWFIVA
jgi:hypothetical protein